MPNINPLTGTRPYLTPQTEEDRLRRRISHLEDDVNTIGATLLDAARDNDLCSVYDDCIDSLNASLHGGISLPVRETDFRVTFTITCSPDYVSSDFESNIDSLLRNAGFGQCEDYSHERP